MAAAATPTPAESRSASAVDAAAIGARVKALRESSGLSLRDLAGRSGVSAPMPSQVERGDTSPTLAVAQKLNVRALAGVAVPRPSYGEMAKDAALTYFTRSLTSARVRRHAPGKDSPR